MISTLHNSSVTTTEYTFARPKESYNVTFNE